MLMITKYRFAQVSMIAAMLLVSGTRASTIINYGDFNVPAAGITFTGVSESSGTDAVPLYGAPHTFVTGLNFDPAGFVASATGGASDLTDGQLNYGIQSAIFQTGSAGIGINSLNVNEFGDYTLAGNGTAATMAMAGVNVHVTVDEVDGVPITPVTFTSNASIAFNLLANPGIVQPWSMGATVPIAADLSAAHIPFVFGATKVEITSDNQLIALSEPSSAAFIAKKDYVISLVTDQVGQPTPEPATLSICGIALFGALSARRRRAM
jgi:hypothetical protein